MNESDQINADIAARLGLTLCVCDLDTNAGRLSSESYLPCNYNLWDEKDDLRIAGKGFSRPKAYWCEVPGALGGTEYHEWDGWQPAINSREALEAATTLGLFGAKPGLGCVLFRHTPDGPWVVGRFRESDDVVVDLAEGPTAAAAICKAIKILTKEPQ